MKRFYLAICFIIMTANFAHADTVSINHFVVKENPFSKNEVAVEAVDTAGNIREAVNGAFTFSMNGFLEQLTFDKGVAFYRHKLNTSTFIYAKHANDKGTHGILYYIYKHDDKLTPIHISWILLIAIPLALVLLGYMFKRFIIIAIVIFCIFMYFNYHNGLSMPTFFESVIDGLKGMFK